TPAALSPSGRDTSVFQCNCGFLCRNPEETSGVLASGKRRVTCPKPTNSGSRPQNLGSVPARRSPSAKVHGTGGAPRAWSSLPRTRIGWTGSRDGGVRLLSERRHVQRSGAINRNNPAVPVHHPDAK